MLNPGIAKFKRSINYSNKSHYRVDYLSRYGEAWGLFSSALRNKIKRCQWCNKKQRHLSQLAGHHIGCVQYNYKHLTDERVVLVVCRECHELLEPWSKINLTQVLPQLYELC
jgi:hypothetical protein